MRPVTALFAVSLVVPALAAPVSRSITLERVPGKDSVARAAALDPAWSGRTLAVVVTDARQGEDPSVVGAQQLKDQVLYEWHASRPVPDAVRAMIEGTLQSWKIGVSQQSDLQLEVGIHKLRVDEVPETFGSSYRSEVELRVRVFTSEGGLILPRTVTGTGKRTGPDRRAKLCNESITAALEDALAHALGPADAQPQPAAARVEASNPNAVPPKAMLKELLRLKDAGVGESVLLGYIRQRRLASPLTTEDILTWKVKGLPESVIQAAQEAK